MGKSKSKKCCLEEEESDPHPSRRPIRGPMLSSIHVIPRIPVIPRISAVVSRTWVGVLRIYHDRVHHDKIITPLCGDYSPRDQVQGHRARTVEQGIEGIEGTGAGTGAGAGTMAGPTSSNSVKMVVYMTRRHLVL